MAKNIKSVTFTINVDKYPEIIEKLTMEKNKEGISRYLRTLMLADIASNPISNNDVSGMGLLKNIKVSGLE